MGFRKGKGTRDAIFQLRIVTQQAIQVKGRFMHALWTTKKPLIE